MQASDTGGDIRVVPFEKRFQSEVSELFASGLVYKHKSHTVQECQKKFTRVKLTPGEGDMCDIHSSFMSGGDGEADGKFFWVALNSSDRVVGHVGVIPSTYDISTPSLYNKVEGVTPNTVCELVRMGVHRESRGQGVGGKLCRALEEHAASRGMKKVVLSTLLEMDLAVALYRKCGYECFMETNINTKDWLGEGEWDELIVSHFLKDIRS